MSGTPNTIMLEVGTNPTIRERLAGGAINPGYLIEKNTSDAVIAHATAAANAQKIIAIENVANAEGIDDAYVSGESTRCWYPRRGDLAYMLVAAAASAIVIGDVLESAGDGTVRIATADAATDTAQRDSVVGYAAEAVNNSGGGSEARIKVEIA